MPDSKKAKCLQFLLNGETEEFLLILEEKTGRFRRDIIRYFIARMKRDFESEYMNWKSEIRTKREATDLYRAKIKVYIDNDDYAFLSYISDLTNITIAAILEYSIVRLVNECKLKIQHHADFE